MVFTFFGFFFSEEAVKSKSQRFITSLSFVVWYIFTLPADLQTSLFHQVLMVLLMLSLSVFIFWGFVSLGFFAFASALI